MASRVYELITVLDPTVGDEKVKSINARIEETIAKFGGTLGKRDDWGRKRLAYEINKKREGIYTLFEFTGPSTNELLAEVDRLCRIEESMLRHLITKVVVGKSKGDPALWEKAMAAMQSAPPRDGRRGRGPMPPPPVEEAVFAAAPEASTPVEEGR